jgi:hypothetical protein
MRLQYWIPVIVFFLLIPVATAFIDGDITITPADWAVAGGPSVPIKIHVENATLGAEVDKANVTLTVLNSTLGTIDQGKKYPINGDVIFYFTPGTVKGSGTIEIFVYYNESIQNTTNTNIKVDHAEPKKWALLTHDSPVTVNNVTPIKIRLNDIYGNSVENISGELHNITFMDSEESDGGFCALSNECENPALVGDCKNNHTHFTTASFNRDGLAQICYKVSTKAGDNYVLVTAPDTVLSNPQFINIMGIPEDPNEILVTVSSPLPRIGVNEYQAVANGKDSFSIYYTVIDQYGNPVPHINIKFTINKIELLSVSTEIFSTNYRGIVDLSPYGPSTIAYTTEITAELPDYPITNERKDSLSFIVGGPNQFVVSANPNIISSRDVPEHENNYSLISAHVMDRIGRGIAGKTINFTIIKEITEGELSFPSSFSKYSILYTTTGTTDSNGFANVPLYPAIFNSSNTNMNLEGNVIIDASLQINETHKINASTLVTYKNYPYLRAEVTFDRNETAINETFNATLCLIGDGYTPPHKPVDVMLIFSRGISMLQNQGTLGIDPEIYVRWAIWNFSKYFDESTDQFGLWTFGDIGQADLLNNTAIKNAYMVGDDDSQNKNKPELSDDALTIRGEHDGYQGEGYPGNGRWYADYATPDTGSTPDSAFSENNSIATMVAAVREIMPFSVRNPTWAGVAFRYGVYKGLQDMIDHSRSEAEIKAVIVLVDENWDLFGDPTAKNVFYECQQHPLNQTNPCVEDSNASSRGSKDYIALPLGGPYPEELQPINYSSETSWQNPSNYARDHDILLFVIEYSEFVDTSRTVILDKLASPSEEYHIVANNPEELNDAFDKIAQQILIYASVNTSLDLDFQRMNVTTVDGMKMLNGSEFFNYTYIEGYSTRVRSERNTVPINDTLPVPPYPSNVVPAPVLIEGEEYIKYPYSIDQTDQWKNNTLSLYVGNMSIGQTWCANYIFQTKELGCVDMFGTSSVCYGNETNKEECIPFEPSILCVKENITGQFNFQNRLNIIDLNYTPDKSTELLTISWLLDYNGTAGTDPSNLKQELYYQYSPDDVTWSGSWIRFATNYTGGTWINSSMIPPYTANLDVRERSGYVKFRVFSYEIPLGGASDEAMIGPIDIGAFREPTIKIE